MAAKRKPWGTTLPLVREALVHADKIVVRPGGFCSIHRHVSKANVFHVLAGTLYVRMYACDHGAAWVHALGPGQARSVPAGVWHQFWCPVACEAVEVYLPADPEVVLDADDIDRHEAASVGGLAGELRLLDDQWTRAFGKFTPRGKQ